MTWRRISTQVKLSISSLGLKHLMTASSSNSIRESMVRTPRIWSRTFKRIQRLTVITLWVSLISDASIIFFITTLSCTITSPVRSLTRKRRRARLRAAERKYLIRKLQTTSISKPVIIAHELSFWRLTVSHWTTKLIIQERSRFSTINCICQMSWMSLWRPQIHLRLMRLKSPIYLLVISTVRQTTSNRRAPSTIILSWTYAASSYPTRASITWSPRRVLYPRERPTYVNRCLPTQVEIGTLRKHLQGKSSGNHSVQPHATSKL